MKKIKPINIILPIIFISFFLININVVYFGDDFWFLKFSTYDFSTYFENLANHYLKDNGRFIVHMFDTFFLKLWPIFWQIFNSVMLSLLCYLPSKIICKNNKEKVPLVTSILFLLIASLDILITRQSVYWITGSFNYIYPLVMFFAYWLTITKLDTHKKSFIWAIIFGILASASVEQAGMMTFGLTILILLSKFKSFKEFKVFIKNNTKLLTLSIITLVGLLTVVLAPSQFIRLETTTENSIFTTIFSNINFIIENFVYSKNIIIFMLLFNIFSLLLNKKSIKSKLILTSCVLNIVINLFVFFYNAYISPMMLFACVLAILGLYATILFYLNKKIYTKLISPLTIASILMLGSQFMMIISPTIGYRNLIFGLIMYAFIIGLIISQINITTKTTNIIISSFILVGLIFNANTTYGYYQTKLTNNKNMDIIQTHSKNQNNITLYKYKDENYAWSMPYISPFHEECFKKYYNLNLDIIWE